MRHLNRILGFVTVGFVLVFMGKVSKTSLYSAYFKTIADVEIRNSQALHPGDADFVAALPKSPQNLLNRAISCGNADPLQAGFSLDAKPADGGTVPAVRLDIAMIGLRYCREFAPRAPGTWSIPDNLTRNTLH
ncbi:MAG: hypothetical protein RLZZ165_2336 [Bacteroidota bacterium]|jgi:hypothetical protein